MCVTESMQDYGCVSKCVCVCVLPCAYLIYCERGNTGQFFIWCFCVSLLVRVHAYARSSMPPAPGESGQPAISEADI